MVGAKPKPFKTIGGNPHAAWRQIHYEPQDWPFEFGRGTCKCFSGPPDRFPSPIQNPRPFISGGLPGNRLIFIVVRGCDDIPLNYFKDLTCPRSCAQHPPVRLVVVVHIDPEIYQHAVRSCFQHHLLQDSTKCWIRNTSHHGQPHRNQNRNKWAHWHYFPFRFPNGHEFSHEQATGMIEFQASDFP